VAEKVINHVYLDRLTLVGFKIDHKLKPYLVDPNNMYVKKRYLANNYPFKETFELHDGILQIGDKRDETNIRVDFNPSNMKYPEEMHKIISCMKYVKTTRVDVAIDVKGINLNDYTVIDELSRKYNIWYSGTGDIETYYIGAPSSDLRIRIYDKAKEMGQPGKWWRFESQWRGEFTDHLDKVSPYDKITILKKDINLDHVKSLKDQVFLRYLLENPGDLNRLSKTTRQRYKKILSNLSELDSSKKLDISTIYKNNVSHIIDHIYNFTKHSFENNVIQV